MDGGEQLKLALGGEVVDGKPAPRCIGGLGPPLQSLDEIAMVELDGEGYGTSGSWRRVRVRALTDRCRDSG